MVGGRAAAVGTRPVVFALCGVLAAIVIFSAASAVAGVTNDFAPLVWLDSADAGTFVDYGAGVVNEWHDKSGNNHHAIQADNNRAPVTWAGNDPPVDRPRVHFGGTGPLADYMNNTTMPALGNGSRTVIFLATPFGSSSSDIAVGLRGYTGGGAPAGTAWGPTDTTIFGVGPGADLGGLASFGNRTSPTSQIMVAEWNLPAGVVRRFTNGNKVSETGGATWNTGAGYVLANWANNLDRFWDGQIREVLIFDRKLSDAERVIIENYLQAKFDTDTPVIPLHANSERYAGDTAANGNYDLDVFGIGRVGAGNELLSVNTDAGLRLSSASLGDDDWLLAGHRTGSNSIVTSGLESDMVGRWDRVWYLDKTDADSSLTATLTFDFSEGGVTPEEGGYVLLYSPTGSFAFTTVATSSPVGDQVSFSLTSTEIPDGYYTLGIPAKGSVIMIR